MTQEQVSDLASNIAFGYEQTPWWYNMAVNQGCDVTTYEKGIPIPAAAERLPVYEEGSIGSGVFEEGIELPHTSKKFVWPVLHGVNMTPRDQEIVGSTYALHQPATTLLPILSEQEKEDAATGDLGDVDEAISVLQDRLLVVGSVKQGRRAWTQFGQPDMTITKEGVPVITKVMFYTGLDGTATIACFTVTYGQCDNTVEMALDNATNKTTVRHTSKSWSRVVAMKEKYNLLPELDSKIQAEITRDIENLVSLKQEKEFFNLLLPTTKPGAEVIKRRSATEKRKRESIVKWQEDEFSDYKGTAFALLQSVDAANRWNFKEDESNRQAENFDKIISGSWDKDMTKARNILATVQ